MASKRSADHTSGSSAPPAKKQMTQFEPVNIGPVYSLEDMDIKVLQFQNRKLSERVEERRRQEGELKVRIEQLEQRQATDDAVLCIVNRYWNQLDEDVRVLLQRFDAEGADEAEKQNESKAVTSFLTLLSQSDKQEIDEKLSRRVDFSERAIGKLLQAYDRLLQRKEKLWESMKSLKEDEDDGDTKKEGKDDKADESKTNKSNKKVLEDEDIKQEDATEIKEEKAEVKIEGDSEGDKDKGEKDGGLEGEKSGVKVVGSSTEAVKEEMGALMDENKRLHNMTTDMHLRHHTISLKNAELQDRLAASETEAAELKNHIEEVEYNMQACRHRVVKMDRHLNDVVARLKTYQEGEIKVQGGGEGVSKNKFIEIMSELEEQRELSLSRLSELEKLQEVHEEHVKEVEKLKMDLSMLPESVITSSSEYKSMQSQFSVLFNESFFMRNQLEECRTVLAMCKNTHFRQIEQMELDELAMQKRLRTEMIEMEDEHAQVRREYDMLRMEFEQTLAANEQTGPINREMRNLISSLKSHNEQLKGEIQRYKRKLKEAQVEITKTKEELQAIAQQQQQQAAAAAAGASAAEARLLDPAKEQEELEKVHAENEALKEVKAEIKKLQEKERETKLHWESLKSMSKDGRDKAQLISSERKARVEMDELKGHMRRLQAEVERRERKRGCGEDEALRKLKKQEEANNDLKKCLDTKKQEEETMLNDMEVTGQAFEDMQEQNVKLIQTLREKDDANFKLMTERIKSNQMQKLLRDEKDVLDKQVGSLQHQVEAQNLVVRKLEEKERLLMNTINNIDKELALRQQSMDMYKRKAVEAAQSAADLKLHLDKYKGQLKEVQVAVTDKTTALQSQTYKYRRMQEDLALNRKKLDRAKKIEMASSADEVLMEEIREYKEQLTCPSCKVKKKDAVLTKCFHVFCLECLKTRYETRQRKCPKCNATFGANDYHRIYLE